MGQTIPTVVREINQEYEGKLGEIESSAAHDRLKLSGFPRPLARSAGGLCRENYH